MIPDRGQDENSCVRFRKIRVGGLRWPSDQPGSAGFPKGPLNDMLIFP